VRPALHIAGTLVGPDGVPVGDGSIGASFSGGDPRAQRVDTSDNVKPDGTFELKGLLPGTYLLQIMSPGHPEPREPVKVTVPPGRSVDGLRLVLDRAGTIRGTVADEDGHPVSGAEVRAGGDSWTWNDGVLTGDDGSFTIEGLRPGAYRVIASRRAWGEEMRAPGSGDDDVQGARANVKAGAVVQVKLTVERQSGRITGTVTQNGKPVSDAFVDAQREPESAAAAEGAARRSMRWEWNRQPVLTDGDGRFTLTRLSPGKYLVRAYRKGGGEAMAEHVPVGTPVALVIRPTASLSGTLVVTGKAAPEEFRLELVDDAAGTTVTETFWRTGGQWMLRELPPGHFKLRGEAREGSAEESVTLTEGQARAGLRLEVKPRASLRGQVVALDTGKPVPGMRVMARLPTSSGFLYMEDDHSGERKNITDAQGRFELQDAPPGRLLVYVFANDQEGSEYEYGLVRVSLQAGQQLELPPIRSPRRRLKGSRDLGGDLGFTLKHTTPTAALEPVPMVVAVVRPGGPAAAAGVKVGDVFTSIDGQDVTGPNDYLFWTLSKVPEGTTVNLGLARGGTLAVTAGPQP
jgi:protocatechuate 3,4-dioxygenase beta subunit